MAPDAPAQDWLVHARSELAKLPFREIYEVGGSLRDELLGRQPKDIDVLVRGHGVDELLDELRRHGRADQLTVAGRLVGARFTPRWGPSQGIDVVPPRREVPIRPGEDGYTGNPHTDFRIEPDPWLAVRDDLERRDFTINAIARDLRSGELIDPFGGVADLRARVLRAVHPTAFRDDPLRILRGVARRARDGLVPDPDTFALMKAEAARLGELSPERVRAELDRTIGGDCPGDGLRLARDVGALAVALPEFVPAIGTPQRAASQAYTVEEHCFVALDEAARRGGDTNLRLAALWHDIGKPHSDGIREHAERGAAIAEQALRRLTYPTATIAGVTHLVREHSYGDDREPTAIGARRFVARVSRDAARQLLMLRRCDRAARGTPPVPEQEAARGEFERLVDAEWAAPLTLAELAVDGDDLRQIGFTPSPELGQALRELLAAVVDDPALNERELLLELVARQR